ncbi:MAG TPA: phosphotransferase [Polyangiaceae bacterium]
MAEQHAKERLAEWVHEVTGRSGFALEALAGGASPRRFSRVRWTEGGSAVLMQVPPETPDRAFADERGRVWPFLEIRVLLESRGVRVPRLLAEDCAHGLLLVEDLGETLAERLERRPEQRAALYRRATLDLAAAQQRLAPLPAGSVVLERAFDAALLGWELEHFWEWGVVARGRSSAGRAGFEAGARFLVDAIAALPRGFVHRDYQSRNLLVRGDGPELELGWVDFQDALLGPRTYDLVALLCDSYQPFERPEVEARLDEYARARGLSGEERALLGREFDLITVQRKLKDAGRFVFIERKRGDSSFLPFVKPTLAIVASALERLRGVPELASLRELVAGELAAA